MSNYFTACDIIKERMLATYGADIDDAITMRNNLILNFNDENIMNKIEADTEDLPFDINDINWYNEEEVIYTYHAALATFEYCNKFYK